MSAYFIVLLVAFIAVSNRASGNSTKSSNLTLPLGKVSSLPTNAENRSAVLQPKNYSHELPPTPNPEELESWIAEQFEALEMDYEDFRRKMDEELNQQLKTPPERHRQVDRTKWVWELIDTVPSVNIYKERCKVCRAGVGLILHYVRLRKSVDELKIVGYSLCIILKAQTPRVCKALVDVYMEQANFILKHTSLSPDDICKFTANGLCGEFDHPDHRWNVTLPEVPKPPVNPSGLSSTAKSSFKVLHITDIHYDPYYQEGTNAVCNEPLCCRPANGPALRADESAGMWGDYHYCDAPKKIVESMLDHINKVHPDIDYILWTGDSYAHGALNLSKEDVTMVLRESAGMMMKAFPSIPIFPTIGNHDTHPPNCFPPPSLNKEADIGWLYKELERQWTLLMFNYTSPTINRGAFYSVKIRPGFRLIALNTQFCHSNNGWLLINSTDPAQMLEWFALELQKAENNGEKVHVLGHIPPGKCLKEWSRNYDRIINRYESTITAQFFGHTHKDEFELFYDAKEKNRPVSVAYIGPSVTPFVKVNPAYRIYYVQGDDPGTTRAVIDHETWVIDLSDANLYSYAYWFKLYTARSAYEMSSLSPQHWDKLITRMAKYQNTFDLFYAHYMENSSVQPPCDRDCKKKLLCDLMSGSSHDRTERCQDLDSIIAISSRILFSSFLLILPITVSCYTMKLYQRSF